MEKKCDFSRCGCHTIQGDELNSNYIDGYHTGLKWKDNYRPGGPYVMTTSSRNDKPEFVERCRQSLQDNKDWLAGFDRGLADQSK
jgi:hypothetical protein